MANTSPSEMKFRRARQEDIEDILSIGDVYFGLDYLQHFLVQYLQDPDYYCYVCELEGRVVAFRYLCVIDGGEALESGGARVNPACRGMGIDQQLAQYAAEDISKEHPKASQILLYTAFKSDVQIRLLRDKPDTFQHLATGNLTSVKAPMRDISRLVNHPAASTVPYMEDIYCPSREEFISEITSLSPQQKKGLFPDEIMVVYWKPYKVMAPNLEKVFSTGAVFWTKEAAHCISLMSCVKVFPCLNGLRVDHYMYGRGEAYIQSHVLCAFGYITEARPHFVGTVEYVLYHPLDVNISNRHVFGDTIYWKPGGYHKYTHHLAGRYLKTAKL